MKVAYLTQLLGAWVCNVIARWALGNNKLVQLNSSIQLNQYKSMFSGENHRAYAHSTRPTTTCHRYHSITLLLAQPSRSTRSTIDGSCFFTLSSRIDVF